MAATSYQRFTLTMNAPWNLAGQTDHDWSVKFHLSGSTPLTIANMEPTVLDLFEPIKKLCDPRSHLARWSYYPQGSTVSSYGMTYTAGQHPCDLSGFVQPSETQQLEVCILCECPVGLNSRGKRVYLRKWLHGVHSAVSVGNTPPTAAAGDPLAKWKAGSGRRLLVPVDPTDGTQGGPWSYKPHL